MGQHRRKYTDNYRQRQLKTWPFEIEAFGSVETKRRQQSDAAELLHLRKDHKRLGSVDNHLEAMRVAARFQEAV